MPLARVVPLLLAIAGACVGDDEESFAQLPCEILDRECQRAVYRATAEVAQMPADARPPVREISVQELEDELRARSETEDDDGELGWSRALSLLGLLPEEQSARDAAIAQDAASIAAYYDAEVKMVSVVDRGRKQPEQDLFVLAHELAHALRDAQSDLIAFRERHATSTDRYAATNSLIEGEAMVIGASVVARAAQGPGYAVDWGRLGTNVEQSAFATIDGSVAPLIAAYQQLPYAFGTRMLGPLWDMQGRTVLDEMYEDPMLTLLAWSSGLAPLVRPNPLQCFPGAPPPGYAGVDSDTLGMAGLLALQVALTTVNAGEAIDYSQGWRDDRIVVFAPATELDSAKRAVAWRIHFDSAAIARAFESRVGCCLPAGARLQALESDLLLLAASDPAVLDGWSDATRCGRAEDVPVAPED